MCRFCKQGLRSTARTVRLGLVHPLYLPFIGSIAVNELRSLKGHFTLMRVSLPDDRRRRSHPHRRGGTVRGGGIAAARRLAARAGASRIHDRQVRRCSRCRPGLLGAKEAQQEFWSTTLWHGSDGCGSSAPTVTYAPEGSGCGIASIGGEASSAECFDFKISETGPRQARRIDPLRRKRRAADGYAAGQRGCGRRGTPGCNLTRSRFSAFATAIIVHFPEGCQLKEPGTGPAANGAGSLNEDTSTGGPIDPVGGSTGDSNAEETLRVHITDAEMEKIWDGTKQTWEDIVPITDMETDQRNRPNQRLLKNAGNCRSCASCASMAPVRRTTSRRF